MSIMYTVVPLTLSTIITGALLVFVIYFTEFLVKYLNRYYTNSEGKINGGYTNEGISKEKQ
jgi:ABC-type spermidine/putrescine transport system permease subunit II